MDAHINSDFGDLISVGIDEVWGGKLAAEYFLEHPCDSYVAIGLDSAVRKAKGFRQVMDEAGEKIRVIEISHHESDYIKILVKKFDELTKNNKKTIGIFSMTGSFENYIISRSLERSLSVGECVNIVAYGNEPRYGEYLPIPRIIQPFQQLGKMAMKKMKNILIGNKEKSAWLKPDIVVPLIK
jgi:DNA-binding LacI/PurR family transcriptional regulator